MYEQETMANPADLTAPVRRRRGRPLMVPPEMLLQQIRRLSTRGHGLFRVHRTNGALYARARRQFGSWEAAVRTAGLDYGAAVERARRAASESRRGRSAGRRPNGPDVAGSEENTAPR